MFAVFVVCAFVSLYNHSTMPESVTVLKKENNTLKAQLSSMLDEIAKLKESIQRHSDSGTVLLSEEGVHCVEFVSKKYDDLHLFRGMAKDKLQRLSAKLEELEVIYQTRATVFHQDIQTPRRELKIRRPAEYL